MARLRELKSRLPILVGALVYGMYVLWHATTQTWNPWNLIIFPFAWLTMMGYTFFLISYILCKILGFYRMGKYGWLIYSGEIALGGVLAVWRMSIMTLFIIFTLPSK